MSKSPILGEHEHNIPALALHPLCGQRQAVKPKFSLILNFKIRRHFIDCVPSEILGFDQVHV